MSQFYLKLNNGTQIPAIGYGGAVMDLYDASPDYETAIKTIEKALDTGYRYIDTARVYKTEKCIGIAIENKIKEELICREDVFILTKLWCDKFERCEVVPSLRESLRDLGLEYVDLYLIHWPLPCKSTRDEWPYDMKYTNIDILETWKGMEECYKLGLAKAIGVSNFNSKQLTRILENCEVKPANIQIECHPFFANKKLIDFCHGHDIIVTAYSPLCGLDERYSAYPDTNRPSIFKDPTIKQIAEKHKRSPAHVTLRYLIQRNLVPIPCSKNQERMKENFQVFDFQLDEEDMSLMESCNKDHRCARLFPDHPNYPFNEEF